MLEGFYISSKGSSQKGEFPPRDTFVGCNDCWSSSQVNFGKSVPLFLSYFHTALLWNMTSLTGTKGRKETNMEQSGGIQKFDFSAKGKL